jgi:hypothetical protein
MKILKKQTVKILFLLLMLLNCSTFSVMAQNTNVNYSRLITAIGTVESKLKDKAVSGVHAGFLQISKVTVAECNRINKIKKVSKRYTLQDRFNHQKSVEMFYTIQRFYNPKGDLHYAILLWNEGCSAMYKPKRKTKYYNKVMKVYNNL